MQVKRLAASAVPRYYLNPPSPLKSPMVGLVLVSHSRALAQATVDLIRRTVAADVPMRFAGGVGNNREELGTDGMEIY
jgi:hypothetical protein